MKLLLLVVAASVINFGCVGGNTYKEDLLSNEKWELILSKTSGPNGTIDNYAKLKACERDNRYNFKPDRNLEIDEGLSKCNPNDPQTYIEGKWSFSDDETHLSLNEIEYFIIQFTDGELMLRSDIEENGQSITVELSFRR